MTHVKDYKGIPIEVTQEGTFQARVNGRLRGSIRLRDLERRIDKEVQGLPVIVYERRNGYAAAPRPRENVAIGMIGGSHVGGYTVELRDGSGGRYGVMVVHADQSVIDGLNALADEQDAAWESIVERERNILLLARKVTAEDIEAARAE